MASACWTKADDSITVFDDFVVRGIKEGGP